MSWLRSAWALTAPTALPAPADAEAPHGRRPRTARDLSVDLAAFAVAAGLGAVLLRIAATDATNEMTSQQVAVDAALGAACCTSLWWRRRWPLGVALACVLLGALSTSATVAGLFALSSLALHRHIRPAVLVAALFVPSAVICSIWLGRPDTWSVLLPTLALAAAAIAWGLFVRARRQLLATLRERAERAEADQLVRAEGARLAERTRIAREMHDVLA
ncbi:MAG: hypothetical protein KDB04_12265, partial [Acidimicrobiales bacterium]|nr:hypothetical protein [Acidimicrobiales bacterium]